MTTKENLTETLKRKYRHAFESVKLQELYGIDRLQERVEVLKEIEYEVLPSHFIFEMVKQEFLNTHTKASIELLNLKF